MAYKQGFRWKPCGYKVPPTPLDTPPVSRWAMPGPVYSAPSDTSIPTGSGLDGCEIWNPTTTPTTTAALPWGTATAPALQPSIPVPRIVGTYFNTLPTEPVPYPPRTTVVRQSRSKTTPTTSTTTTTATTKPPVASTSGVTTRGRSRSRPSRALEPSRPGPSRPAVPSPAVAPSPRLVVVPVTVTGVPGTSRSNLDMVSVVQQYFHYS